MNFLNFVANNWDSILAVGGVVGTWLGLKKKQSNENDRWELLLQLARQQLPKLLNDPHLTDDAYVRATLTKAIWAGLSRLKIKHSAPLDKLVDEAVEYAVGELAAKLVDKHLEKFISASEKTAGVLKEATAS